MSGPALSSSSQFSWVTAVWALWFSVSLIQTKIGVYFPNQEKYLGYAAIFIFLMAVLENRHEKRVLTGATPGLALWGTVFACGVLTKSLDGISNSAFLTALVLLEWTLPKRRMSSMRILTAFAETLLVAGVALIPVLPQFVFGASVTRIVDGGGAYRFQGFGFHPNDWAPFALIATMCLASRPQVHMWRRIVILCAGIVSIYLTESRFVWIVAAVLLPILVTAMWSEQSKLRTRRLLLLPVLGTISVVPIAQFLLPRVSLQELTSSNGRLTVWRFVLQHWRDHLLVGHGVNVFDELRRTVLPRWAWHAHNVFLQELFVRGLLGLSVLIVVLVIFVVRGVRNFLNHPVLLLSALAIVGTGYMNVVYAPEYLNVTTLAVILTLAAHAQPREG